MSGHESLAPRMKGRGDGIVRAACSACVGVLVDDLVDDFCIAPPRATIAEDRLRCAARRRTETDGLDNLHRVRRIVVRLRLWSSAAARRRGRLEIHVASRKAGPPLFVLVADEDDAVRATMGHVAKAENLELTAVPSFKDGAEQSDRFQKLDILIADWALPDGSGLDLAAHVQRKHKDCVIVLLGETGSLKLANELYRGGVSDFIRKPLPKGKDLVKRVRRAIIAAERDGQTAGGVTMTTSVIPKKSADKEKEDAEDFDGGEIPTIIIASLEQPPTPPPEEKNGEAVREAAAEEKARTRDLKPLAENDTQKIAAGDRPQSEAGHDDRHEDGDDDLELVEDDDLELIDDDDFEPIEDQDQDQGQKQETEAAPSTSTVNKSKPESAAKRAEAAAEQRLLDEEAARLEDEESAARAKPVSKTAPGSGSADTHVILRPPELELDDESIDLDEAESLSSSSHPSSSQPSFGMNFRSIPDFEPIDDGDDAADVPTIQALDPGVFSQEVKAIDEEAETASPDQDFQISISEPAFPNPHAKDQVLEGDAPPPPPELDTGPADDHPLQVTGVFGSADTTPIPPKSVKDKTWTQDIQATGIFDPNLTQAVWEKKLAFGTGGYFGKKQKESENDYYEIERELATGRNATIYLARWPGEQVSVALKVLSPKLSDDVRFRQRFRREIRSNAALRHDNIIKVHKYGRKGGSYYLALELMKGSLRDVLTAAGPLPTAVIALLLDDLLKGVAFAHRRGVIHRDLKPANLMFGYEGVLKIGDFHFAKNTLDPNKSVPGVRLGTAPYFSPEQARGLELDGRSDLFTVGTLIYEMVTGKNPFDQGNDTDSMMAVSAVDVVPLERVAPGVHPLIAAVCNRLLNQAPEDRFASGNQILEELGPLFKAVYKRYPEIRRQFAKSPPDLVPQLVTDEARLETRYAKRLIGQGPEHARRAAIAIQRALLLDPGFNDAHELFADLKLKHSYSLDQPASKDYQALLEKLETGPADVETLRMLTDRTRKTRNIFLWESFLRRYVRANPSDTKAANELAEFSGPNPYAPFVKDRRAKPEPASDETP